MIMVDSQRIGMLIAKNMLGSLSAPEKEELEMWIRQSPDAWALMQPELRPERFAERQRALWDNIDEESLDRKMRQKLEQNRK